VILSSAILTVHKEGARKMKLNFKLTLLLGAAVWILSGCTTTQKETMSTQQGLGDLSLEELQSSLGIETGDLGPVEKIFNSCSLPKPLRGDGQCGSRFFTLVHFRVQCRNSMGTTQNAVTSLDLEPFQRNLEWVVGPYRGIAQTNSDGYGQVRIVSSRSVLRERFVLKNEKMALGVTTRDVSRIIVPQNWCQ